MYKFAADYTLDVEMVVAAVAVRKAVYRAVSFAVGKFKETFFRRHFIKAAVDRSPVYGGAGFLKSAGNIGRAYRAALSLQKIKYVFPRFCVVILSFVHSMTSEEPQAAHNQKEGCASGSPLRYGSMRSNNTLQVTAKAYRGLSFL